LNLDNLMKSKSSLSYSLSSADSSILTGALIFFGDSLNLLSLIILENYLSKSSDLLSTLDSASTT